MGNKHSKEKSEEVNSFPTNKEIEICRRANRLFHGGNSIMALRIMEKYCNSFINSGLVHRVHADICVHVAMDTKDTTIRKMFIDKAIDLCQRAVSLTPNSIEFCEFYLRLLFYNGYYEKVIEEGERGLAIQTPIDPAQENWADGKANFKSLNTRIDSLRKSIQTIVDDSRLISFELNELTSDEETDLHRVFNNILVVGTMEMALHRGEIEGSMAAVVEVQEIVEPARTFSDMLLNLNDDCLGMILVRFGPICIIEKCPFLIPLLRSTGYEPLLFETIDLRSVTQSRIGNELMQRGLGFMRELNLGTEIGTDQFFISNRDSFSTLRKLKLWCCKGLSKRLLVDTVEHLPLLESFHTCECLISEPILEQLSLSCPQLSEFSMYCKDVTMGGLDIHFFEDDDLLVYIEWMSSYLGEQITKFGLRGFVLGRQDINLILRTFRNLIEIDLDERLIVRVQEEDLFKRIYEYMVPPARKKVE